MQSVPTYGVDFCRKGTCLRSQSVRCIRVHWVLHDIILYLNSNRKISSQRKRATVDITNGLLDYGKRAVNDVDAQCLRHQQLAIVALFTVDMYRQSRTRNSSEDEIANVNFLYDDTVYALQNTIDSCINCAPQIVFCNAGLPNSVK